MLASSLPSTQSSLGSVGLGFFDVRSVVSGHGGQGREDGLSGEDPHHGSEGDEAVDSDLEGSLLLELVLVGLGLLDLVVEGLSSSFSVNRLRHLVWFDLLFLFCFGKFLVF